DTPATYCLRTNPNTDDRREEKMKDDCSTFNRLYGVKLPTYKNVDNTTPSFLAVRANADRNSNGIVDQNELIEARLFAGNAAILSEIFYMVLGGVKSCSQPPGATFPIDYFGISTAKLITSSEYELFQLNDLLVTYESAIYSPFKRILQDSMTRYDHGGVTRDKTVEQLYLQAMPSRK
ncbi:MAG: hypothetical protein AAB869_03445, partial [Patescibacteria group bacterium]